MYAKLPPRIVGKIDDNRLGSAADDDPAEGRVFGAIDFAVHQPCGDVQKISGAGGQGMLSALSPLDVRFTGQNVRYRFLRAVMMDAGLRPWLDEEGTAPKRRVDAQVWRDSREAL